MPEELGGTAVAEPVEASTATESSVESPETPSEGGESPESTSSEVTEQVPQTQDGKQGLKPRLNLNDAVKKHAAALKAIDPQLADAVRNASFRLGGFEREFPGGLKEAQALKVTFDGLGGAEGLKETQEAVADYGQLETWFEKGDPQFINRLADEAPQSFSAIMPTGLEKWKSVDPDSYNHVLAQVMVQTLDSARFSSTLEAIWERLDDKEQKPLKDAIASLWQTVDNYRKVGEKAPEKKVSPQDEALSRREQELAQKEQRLFLAPIRQSVDQHRQKMLDAEMNRGYRWNEASSDVQQAVNERVRLEMVSASKKDKAFSTAFDRYVERGDSAGLQRHIENFQQRVGPGIVEKVARLFNVKPKGAGTPIAVKVPPQAARPNGVVSSKDWERIARQPAMGEWDRVKTTADMVLENRAILKNGKRVTWA